VWLLAALMAAWTAAGTAEDKKPEWTVDDILLAESAGQFQISPDGKWAVWVRSAADKEKGESVSNLWLSSLTEKKELQLTRGTVTHSAPRWSPDGALISFLSTRALPESVKKSDLSRRSSG
jgi:dipeptidyl aminopeptidase/acylaminoacyl peptidase